VARYSMYRAFASERGVREVVAGGLSFDQAIELLEKLHDELSVAELGNIIFGIFVENADESNQHVRLTQA